MFFYEIQEQSKVNNRDQLNTAAQPAVKFILKGHSCDLSEVGAMKQRLTESWWGSNFKKRWLHRNSRKNYHDLLSNNTA